MGLDRKNGRPLQVSGGTVYSNSGGVVARISNDKVSDLMVVTLEQLSVTAWPIDQQKARVYPDRLLVVAPGQRQRPCRVRHLGQRATYPGLACIHHNKGLARYRPFSRQASPPQ